MLASQFDVLATQGVDRILELAAEARAARETHPDVIDATAGVLKREDGSDRTVVFESVVAAEKLIPSLEQSDGNYSGALGIETFRKTVSDLLGNFPDTATIAAASGTQALNLNMYLLGRMAEKAGRNSTTMVLPEPAWANHPAIAKQTNIDVISTRFLDNMSPTIEPILKEIRKGANAVLLQVACQNPTGIDFTPEQWEELAKEMEKHGTLAFMDFAYQGFADEPEDDAKPLRTMYEAGVDVLGSWSASKSYGIYGWRTGLSFAFAESKQQANIIESVLGAIQRVSVSTPATRGQHLVSLVQETFPARWREELRHARTLLRQKREALSLEIPDFAQSLSGNGLFACLPLDTEQTKQLKEEQRVFLVPTPNGARLNLGGIPFNRFPELAEKIQRVL